MKALRKVLRDPFISSTNGSLIGYLVAKENKLLLIKHSNLNWQQLAIA